MFSKRIDLNQFPRGFFKHYKTRSAFRSAADTKTVTENSKIWLVPHTSTHPLNVSALFRALALLNRLRILTVIQLYIHTYTYIQLYTASNKTSGCYIKIRSISVSRLLFFWKLMNYQHIKHALKIEYISKQQMLSTNFQKQAAPILPNLELHLSVGNTFA